MFDAYHKWLGIAPKDQPPNHYRLLGIDLFESDPEVIDAAANRQMAYLQQRATGDHAALSQRLLNEVATARLCLLDAAKKAAYDAQLRTGSANAGKSINSRTSPPRQVIPSKPLRKGVADASHDQQEGTGRRYIAATIGAACLTLVTYWAIFVTGPEVEIKPRDTHETEAALTDAGAVGKSPPKPPELPSESSQVASPRVDVSKKSDAVTTASTETNNYDAAREEPIVYTVDLSPPQATLKVVTGEARIAGNGATRTVRLEGSYAQVIATCRGYESASKWLMPTSDHTSKVELSLKRIAAAVRSDPIPPRKPIILRGHKHDVQCVAVSLNGRYIVSGGVDRSVRLWDLRERKQLWADHSLNAKIWSVAFSPDSRHVWASGGQVAKCFDCSDSSVSRTLRTCDTNTGNWPAVAFSHDASRLAISAKGVCEIYGLAAMTRVFRIDNAWIPRAIMDRQDRIICGGNEGQGRIDQRDGSTGKVIRSFHGLRDRTMALTLSADEKYLAAASGPAKNNQRPPEYKIIVWRYVGGVVQEFSVRDGWQYALAFSPDNQFLVSGGSGKDSDWQARNPSSDRSIRVWNISTGREVRRFEGHEGAVRCLAFTPDGGCLVSGSADSTVRVWPYRK